VWLLAAAILLCAGTWNPAAAQLPVVKGKSTTQSGMIYYDANSAEDKRERIYSYTVCPDSAGCISLDFNLIRSEQANVGQVEGQDAGTNFVRIFDGQSTAAPLIASFGTVMGTKFIQTTGGCVTVEFTRDAKGLNAVWTAMWRARSAEACIRPMEANPCANVQDICGPEFHENFHYFGKQTQSSATLMGSCLDQTHNETWYRFAIAETGKLQFEIIPDNGFDDFDWVLLKADPKKPADCPALPEADARLACNNATGRGHAGATGMGEKGQSLNAGSSGNPYCQPLAVEKGDIFFLLIDDYSKHSSGFTIRFNDVVMDCKNPHKDFLQIARDQALGTPPVDPRKSFSKYTRVLRIDLSEKANLPLAQSLHPTKLFQDTHSAGKPLVATPQFCDERGIVSALLNGLKLGCTRAYSAHDFRSPLHFGDFLDLAQRQRRDSIVPRSNWWDPRREDIESYLQVVELIVDETFDKISGIKRQHIRYIRVLWTDRDGKAPDYNVAVFNYAEVQDLLDRIPLENGHNDANSMSIKDFLENQMYTAVMVDRSNKSINTLQQSKFAGDRQVELESFIWDR
jgi:hypothetical protein